MDLQGLSIPFHHKQCGRAGSVESVDVQGVSLFIVSSVEVQGVSLSTVNNVEVQGESLLSCRDGQTP